MPISLINLIATQVLLRNRNINSGTISRDSLVAALIPGPLGLVIPLLATQNAASAASTVPLPPPATGSQTPPGSSATSPAGAQPAGRSVAPPAGASPAGGGSATPPAATGPSPSAGAQPAGGAPPSSLSTPPAASGPTPPGTSPPATEVATVPHLLRKPVDLAVQELAEAGLVATVVEIHHHTILAGEVVYQDLAPGGPPVPVGTTVTLTVSQGPAPPSPPAPSELDVADLLITSREFLDERLLAVAASVGDVEQRLISQLAALTNREIQASEERILKLLLPEIRKALSATPANTRAEVSSRPRPEKPTEA